MKRYLERGGILTADACCGAIQFDTTFREFVLQLFSNKKLARIPLTHELFSEKSGREIKLLNRRTSEDSEIAAGENLRIVSAEPVLEGIEFDGRYALIDSKIDIRCALTGKDSGNCDGYLPDDAFKLGSNIILYTRHQTQPQQQEEKILAM